MITDHSEMVRVLVKPGQDILNSLDASKVHLWHAATGISGEGGELLEGILLHCPDKANVIEESGDLYFYIEQLQQAADFRLDWDQVDLDATSIYIGPTSIAHFTMKAAVLASQVLDTVKKQSIYNKPINMVQLKDQAKDLAICIGAIGIYFKFSRQDALDANISKLSVRYAGMKYSDKAAQERADKA